MQKGNELKKNTTFSVYACVRAHTSVFSSLSLEHLSRSKLLTLISDLGFHLETPYVLFSDQTLHDVIPAILICLGFYNRFENL